MSSNFALVRLVSICLGPSAVAVTKGRLMELWVTPESSILAFSAASVNLHNKLVTIGTKIWYQDPSAGKFIPDYLFFI